MQTTLTDQNGRVLSVTLIGRSVTSVTFLRGSDGVKFELALDKLSPPDRARIEALPLKIVSSPPPENLAGPLKFKRASLDELRQEIEENLALLASSKSQIKIRSLQNQILRLQKEEKELLEEIGELQNP